MKKILLTLIMMFALLLTAATCVYGFSDIENIHTQRAAGTLSHIGVINGRPDGLFHPQDTLTRAELSKMTVYMMNMGNEAESFSNIHRFTDVEEYHWASKYINLLSGYNIINGYEDSTFRPENNVTAYELIKIAVTYYGYGIIAESNGGYPEGYYKIALQLGLLKNTEKMELSAPVTRGNAAVIYYNLLCADFVEQNDYNGKEITFDKNGKTVLEHIFAIYEDDGVVTATQSASLGRELTSNGYITIDDVLYKEGETDVENMLGCRITFLYRIDENDDKIILSYGEYGKTVETVWSKDICDVSGIYTSNAKISYYVNKRINTRKLKTDAYIIYNGDYVSPSELGLIDFTSINGYVEIISWEGNGEGEALRIYDGSTMIASSVISGEEVYIMGRSSGETVLSFDTADEEYSTHIYSSGEEISPSAIEKEDVLTVYKSLNGKNITVYVSKNRVEGSIDSIEDDVQRIIEISGNSYNVSPGFINMGTGIRLAAKGIAYLDYKNEVVYFESEEGGNYAYFTRFAENGGIKNSVDVLLLMPNNTFEEYELASKIRFTDKDGVNSTITPMQFANLVRREPQFYDKRTAESQMIEYDLDADGKINEIKFAGLNRSYRDFSIDSVEKRHYYSNYLFDQKYKVTADTLVFKIPCSNFDGELEDRFSSGRADKFFSVSGNYQVEIYNVNEKGEIGALLYRVPGQKKTLEYSVSTASSKVMVIEKVSDAADKDGIWHTRVTGIVNGEYESYWLSDEIKNDVSVYSKLKFGNVIQFATNSDEVKFASFDGVEEIKELAVLLNTESYKYQQRWNGSKVLISEAARTTTVGTINEIGADGRLLLDLPDNDEVIGQQMPFYVTSSVNIIRANKDNKKAELIEYAQIKPTEKVFVRQRYNVIKEIVVFE